MSVPCVFVRELGGRWSGLLIELFTLTLTVCLVLVSIVCLFVWFLFGWLVGLVWFGLVWFFVHAGMFVSFGGWFERETHEPC